jgi:hypothetical protein
LRLEKREGKYGTIHFFIYAINSKQKRHPISQAAFCFYYSPYSICTFRGKVDYQDELGRISKSFLSLQKKYLRYDNPEVLIDSMTVKLGDIFDKIELLGE